MGFNIDINKLKGEWKQWAETADTEKGDNDKHLNSVLEVDEVITKALEAGKSADDIAAVFNADFKKTEGAEDKKSPKSDKTAQQKRMRKEVLNKLEKTEFTGDWDKFAENMTASMISDTQSIDSRIYYSKLTVEVRKIVNEMKNHPYKNKTDIKALEDKVKDALKIDDNDELKDFKADVIDTLVDMAKADQKDKEYLLVQNEFNKLIEQGKTREEAVKELKSKYKGSYFPKPKEFAKANASEEVWNTIESLLGQRKITKSIDIKNATIAILQKNGKYDKYAEDALDGHMAIGDRLKWDRSQIKAYRKYIASENRAMVAREKDWTEDEITDALQTKEAFAGLISKDVKMSYADGSSKIGRLITEKVGDDGKITYDISNLQDVIRDAIGADLRANRQKSDYEQYDEVKILRNKLSALIGCDLKKSDAKHLIKLCGFEYEGLNLGRIVYDTAVGVVTDAVTVAAGFIGLTPEAVAATLVSVPFVTNATAKYIGPKGGEVSFNYDSSFPVTVDYKNSQDWNLTINYGNSGGVNLTSLRRQMNLTTFSDGTTLSDYLKIDNSDGRLVLSYNKEQAGSVNIIKEIHEVLKKYVKLQDLGIDPDTMYEIETNTELDLENAEIDQDDPKLDLTGAILKMVGLSFAINFLQAVMKQHGELPKITTQFNETDINQYFAKLSRSKNMTPDVLQGLRMVAETFIKDGKWNSDGYKRFLNTIAGDESFANKHELNIGVRQAMHKVKSEEPQQQAVQQTFSKPVEQTTVEPEKKDPEIEVATETSLASTYTPKSVKFTAWQDLVNGYGLNADMIKDSRGKSVDLSNRMVKIIQAMDLTKVPADKDIKEVYNISRIADFARIVIEKDIDAAMAKYPDFPVDKQKYIDVRDAKGGVKGDVVIPDLYDDEGNSISWEATDKVKTKKGKGSVTTVDVTKRTINGQTAFLKREAGSGDAGWTRLHNQKEYDDLIKQGAKVVSK